MSNPPCRSRLQSKMKTTGQAITHDTLFIVCFYSIKAISAINLGAIIILSNVVLICVGILAGKLWLRHWDAVWYLRSIVGNKSNIISFMAISTAITRKSIPCTPAVCSCFLPFRLPNFHDWNLMLWFLLKRFFLFIWKGYYQNQVVFILIGWYVKLTTALQHFFPNQDTISLVDYWHPRKISPRM